MHFKTSSFKCIVTRHYIVTFFLIRRFRWFGPYSPDLIERLIKNQNNQKKKKKTRLTWPCCFHSFISCKIWYPTKNDSGSDVGVENCGLNTYCLNPVDLLSWSFFIIVSGLTRFMPFKIFRNGDFFSVVLWGLKMSLGISCVVSFSLCL